MKGTTMRPLEAAHPEPKRADALAALKEHGSLRKAAAAVGVSKSSLHRWAADELGQAGNPDQPDTAPGPPETSTNPTGVLWMRAFNRYCNLLANGVQPEHALRAAQNITPDFELDPSDDAEIQTSIGAMTFSESLEFAAKTSPPPAYVSNIVDSYSMDASQQAALADSLYAGKLDAYMAGINDQLTKLGRDPISAITDQNVLDSIRNQADNSAQMIADNWNRDAASQASKVFTLDVSGGSGYTQQTADDGTPYLTTMTTEERQAALDDAMQQWTDGRMDWKPSMWSINEATASYNDGASSFVSQNGDNVTVESEQVLPDECMCDGCQDLVDLGVQPAGTFDNLDLPLHIGCTHSVDYALADVPSDVSLWTGGGDTSAEQATAV